MNARVRSCVRHVLRGCALLLLVLLSAPAQAAVPAAVDANLLLRGGTIHDGSGQEGVVGDVAVRGEKIVAVGNFRHGNIARAIDCAGLVVAPGFIDPHTHSDGALNHPAARQSANYLLQGCTTVVTGNCGGGPADVVVFDPKQFLDRATYEEPQQYAAGVRYGLIAGRFAVEDGRLGKPLHGRALRRPAPLAPPRAAP